jgi:hypothetical protein
VSRVGVVNRSKSSRQTREFVGRVILGRDPKKKVLDVVCHTLNWVPLLRYPKHRRKRVHVQFNVALRFELL